MAGNGSISKKPHIHYRADPLIYYCSPMIPESGGVASNGPSALVKRTGCGQVLKSLRQCNHLTLSVMRMNGKLCICADMIGRGVVFGVHRKR